MSVHMYPVTPTALSCNDYRICINGAEVTPDTARVSAVPFNRRWPGHQRGLEQTELVNFLSLSADEPLTFEITPKEPFETVAIRPASLGVTPTVTPEGTVTFTLPEPAYFTVEPYGRNHALHVFVDPPEAYDINPNDPNVIYYGAGEHEVGQITLHSNQTLFLDEGAVVYACVSAMDAEHIRIVGRGILDNSHNREVILYEANEIGNEAAVNNAVRQHTVQLEYCTDIEIEGITIRDSLVYNVRPIGCEDLRIANVKIIGCWRYNSDGIDMHNCVNVQIENCFLRTFDDAICVKGFDCYYEDDVEAAVQAAMYRGGKSYDVFRNVRVRNCVIWNDWGKSLEIGAETRAEEICDILFEDCHVIHVCGPVLDCCNVDYADVHHVTYRNITVELDDTIPPCRIQERDEDVYVNDDPDNAPPIIYATVEFHFEYSAGGTRRGKNRELTFENIRVLGRHWPRAEFKGYSETAQTENVEIRDLFRNGKRITSEEELTLVRGPHTAAIRLMASE